MKKEIERLHQSTMLDLWYVPFDSIDSKSKMKFAFNNCRSLPLHYEDIKHCQALLSSHAFGVAKSRLNHK